MQDNEIYSPYLEFSRDSWQKLRKDTPLTLTEADLEQLRGQNEPVSLQEVIDIYLPLSRLLNLYVSATQNLHQITGQFLNNSAAKVPFIIGIAGSVAVGKSTVSRVLKALLSRWPHHPRVELVTTDGFIYPNAILEERNLMEKKGFPESYDLRRLIELLYNVKAGKPNLSVPIYSHHFYDIIPNEFQIINQPDILILEGLNVLQIGVDKSPTLATTFVSDFFDFSIYVDAETSIIEDWYLQRFMTFRNKAQHDPQAFFYQFAQMPEPQALKLASYVWKSINERNLNENILPFKNRARLILKKNSDHSIEKIFLRKL